jgi:hypothetical protein
MNLNQQTLKDIRDTAFAIVERLPINAFIERIEWTDLAMAADRLQASLKLNNLDS